MTKEKVREYIGKVLDYVGAQDDVNTVLEKAAPDLLPKEQIKLSQYYEESRSKTILWGIQSYNKNFDANIIHEIIRKSKATAGFNTKDVFSIRIFCSAGFMERFNEVFSYSNYGGEFNHNRFDANEPAYSVLTKNKVKLYFIYYREDNDN